ncbi:hypothetical protein BDU57DRAFT_524388 [Ampelomyces quisqualis]|uniref:Secreted protein n=1 Tax=Ampelomyces quisqualis TaxID=50730 RepID=A0A6A5Q9D2_AMPQU|nr:hypothetical protein BDU57DRAFT_524388 [Ampelomyces quisqualis]
MCDGNGWLTGPVSFFLFFLGCWAPEVRAWVVVHVAQSAGAVSSPSPSSSSPSSFILFSVRVVDWVMALFFSFVQSGGC